MPFNGDLPTYLEQDPAVYPDEYPAIKLTFGSDSVWLYDFQEGNAGYDRKIPEGGEVRYSLAGTPIVEHVSHKGKHLWTINTYAPTQARNLFWRIVDASIVALRTPPFAYNYAIRLHDIARTIVEDSQTRASAAGSWQDSVGSGICYFAQFDVLIPKNSISEAEVGGNNWLLTFSMFELKKVTA